MLPIEAFLTYGLAFGAVITAAAAAFYFSAKATFLRDVRSYPVRPVREVVDGEVVRVVGRVEYVGTPLAAPISGRGAAVFRVVVQERVQSGRSSTWRRVTEEVEAQPFVVRDATGAAFVRDPSPEVLLVEDHEQRSGFLRDATPELAAYLARFGQDSVGMLGMNRTLRYLEGVVEQGETIAVVGRARWEADDSGGASSGDYRSSPKRLVIEPTEARSVRISDEPGARS